jgi:hypothetical protein
MNDRDGEERLEACGETFPAHDQAAVLPQKPGQCPLGLEARDGLFDGAPTRLSRLPHPFGNLGPDTTGAEAMTEVFGIIPLIRRLTGPREATWAALMVLYTACLRYGAPDMLISDSGGAYISTDFEAVCTQLQIQHETIESTKAESYRNLMETHFNIQRRLYDYQFSLAHTPAELEQCHQHFIQTYNTTAQILMSIGAYRASTCGFVNVVDFFTRSTMQYAVTKKSKAVYSIACLPMSSCSRRKSRSG